MILFQVPVLEAAGLALGVPAALGASKLVASFLFDQTGAYRIEGLKPGQYTARFSKTGFLESIRGDGIQEAQIPVATAAFRLDGQLTPLASIRGRVLDTEGKPAAGATVGEDGLRKSRRGIPLSNVFRGAFTGAANKLNPAF